MMSDVGAKTGRVFQVSMVGSDKLPPERDLVERLYVCVFCLVDYRSGGSDDVFGVPF